MCTCCQLCYADLTCVALILRVQCQVRVKRQERFHEARMARAKGAQVRLLPKTPIHLKALLVLSPRRTASHANAMQLGLVCILPNRSAHARSWLTRVPLG